MFSTDAEDLIARLSHGLHPADHTAIRREAEAAINSPGECWGPGLIHRTVTAVWKNYFRPPEDAPLFTSWDSNRKRTSKLVSAPARVRRRPAPA